MKVLVTGGGGFIGSSLIKELNKIGYSITSISRNTYPILNNLGVSQIVGDINDYELVKEACKAQDVVFHIAAKVGLWGNYSEFYSTNVVGTKNIINACKANNVKYLIYTSSASVVFDGYDIENGNEFLPYPKKNHSNYATTKGLAEKLILKANTSTLKTVSLRPHLVCGPGDSHLIPGILNRAKKGSLMQIGDNDKLIDTTHIDNLIDAQILALNKLNSNSPVDGQAYFITNGLPIRTWDFINSILVDHGLTPTVRKIPKNIALLFVWIFETYNMVFSPEKEPKYSRFMIKELCTSHWFDISKAKRLLSFKPKNK